MLPAHVVRLGRGVGSIGRNLLICLMRTTLNIDDELYRQIKATAALRGCSVTSLVEESLRAVLHQHLAADAVRPVRVLPQSGGVRPGIDLTSNRSLRDALDAPDLSGADAVS